MHDYECACEKSNKLLKPICSTMIFTVGLLIGLGITIFKSHGLVYNTVIILCSSLVFYLSQINISRLFNKSVSR